MRTWLLPEYIEDVLPFDAQRLEDMRRRLLDLFRVHGYELVMPPLLEYVDSLLSATGEDMDLATFKLVDQLSGRHMGIRADHTPQVARIDAHLLNRPGVTRLCYAGSVLHTLPSGVMRSREPFQIGAELYGHRGLEADVEVMRLMVDALQSLGLSDLQVDISHPGIFHAVIADSGLDEDAVAAVFAAIKAKDLPALRTLCAGSPAQSALLALPELYGDQTVLTRASERLPSTSVITAALDALTAVVKVFAERDLKVSIDLGELGGFNYERGITFAAYVSGSPDAIARGGRYDEVGEAFGRARPATGFTLDLKPLLELIPRSEYAQGIFAPPSTNAALLSTVEALRKAGEIVVRGLPGEAPQDAGCDRELKQISGEWQVVPRA